MSTAIEQEQSDTTLCGCIEDSVVVVSLMFHCNSFLMNRDFRFQKDKSEIALRLFSHSRVRKEFLFSNFNANGTLG